MKSKQLALLLLIVGGVLIYLVITNTPTGEVKEYKPGPLKENEYKWIEKQVEL